MVSVPGSTRAYASRRQAEAPQLLESAAARIEDCLRHDFGIEEEEIPGTLTRITRVPTRTLLDRLYFGIGLVVGTEPDTTTPGKRGLGRVSKSPPRFGGAFRKPLRALAEPAELFGPKMEELIVGGFAAAAAYDDLLDDGPSAIADRDPTAVVEFWIARMVYALQGASQSIRALLEASAGTQLDDFISAGETHGLLRGLRGSSRRATLEEIGIFLAGAGVDLFMCSTARSEGEFQTHLRARHQ